MFKPFLPIPHCTEASSGACLEHWRKRLNHPNVLPVYDYGELEDDRHQPYLVLEYVLEQALAAWQPEKDTLVLGTGLAASAIS
jgi:hypothetical protein